MKRLNRIISVMAMASAVAAIYQQLRRPARDRDWHGQVFGAIPYDFRVPTVESVRAAYWNPADPHVFTSKVLGVGWAINFYQVWHGLAGALTRTAD